MREPRSKEISLNGHWLLLHERRAVDVYNFSDWFKEYPEPENDTESHIFAFEQAARIVFDALAPNYYSIPAWRIWKRYKMGKAIRLQSIMELPSSMLFALAADVAVLESGGEDVKKKAMQLAENTQPESSATSGE